MIGIYKIQNKINNKIYIGQSHDILQRWAQHKKKAFTNNNENNKYLYRAFRKYGLENFTFEVLEECLESELNEKERYYILYYNSNDENYGYNTTSGGEYPQFGVSEEKHPNHKVTKEDVYFIRECYNNHQDKNEVYENFKHLISDSGFNKIWNGLTWKTIHYDVYTKENKDYYDFKRNSHPGSLNGRAKLNEQDVREIRTRKKSGESLSQVFQDYSFMSYGSFKNTWNYQNWKQIIV